MKRTGDARLLRRVNRSAVLDLIYREGPLPRAEIARRLQLSPPTVTRIVSKMLEEGAILESEVVDSQGGRPATLLRFNPQSALMIGVYIGQQVVGALADLNGQIIESRTERMECGDGGVEQLIQLISALHAKAHSLGIPVRGVGVGAPSIVQYPEGIVVWSPTLGWRNLPLRNLLQDALHLPVFVENEVNLIVLGENWRGVAQGLNNVVCISLGDGIGAGLILNGKLYRGTHCASGEIGYLIPGRQFLGYAYDTYGCLEGLAGCSGIVRRFWTAVEAGASSMLFAADRTEITAETILIAATQGDEAAAQVVDETIDYIVIAIANLSAILDPEMVIISGELAKYGSILIDEVRRRFNGLAPHTPPILVSASHVDAAVMGAVASAMMETSNALELYPRNL
ncbi:MAG: ROK family transcriptional regulator [Caldilinea sp.]|jgi:predicted NBD/HSP70 family sugar kinase|uniref:ROK family transcriptional regulator n=1 Tax=Caldilinea sp. TaxID=2293560 RepID=UPI0030B62A69